MTSEMFPLSRHALNWMTNFGDLGLLLPLAGVVFLWLFWEQGARLSLQWAAAFCGSIVSIGASKFLFAAFPLMIGSVTFHSPSGHACISATLYGTIALVMSGARARLTQRVMMVVMTAVVLAITVSRIALRAHSVPDAIAGVAIGGAWLIPIWMSLRAHGVRAGRYWLLGAPLLLTAMVMHDVRLPIYRYNIVPIYRLPDSQPPSGLTFDKPASTHAVKG